MLATRIFGMGLINLFLTILGGQILAQESRTHLTVSGGLTIVDNVKGIHRYSGTGWGVGIGIARDINVFVQLSGEVSFHRFPFDRESLESSVPSLGRTVIGESSNMYQASVGARFAFVRGSVRPFLSVRGGAFMLISGLVAYEKPYVLRSAETSLMGFVSIGFGIESAISSNISLSLTASIETPFVVKAVAVPITSRWHVRL